MGDITRDLALACQRLLVELEWYEEKSPTNARKLTRTETITEAKRAIQHYQTMTRD